VPPSSLGQGDRGHASTCAAVAPLFRHILRAPEWRGCSIQVARWPSPSFMISRIRGQFPSTRSDDCNINAKSLSCVQPTSIPPVDLRAQPTEDMGDLKCIEEEAMRLLLQLPLSLTRAARKRQGVSTRKQCLTGMRRGCTRTCMWNGASGRLRLHVCGRLATPPGRSAAMLQRVDAYWSTATTRNTQTGGQLSVAATYTGPRYTRPGYTTCLATPQWTGG
jgi:hypothetical protein